MDLDLPVSRSLPVLRAGRFARPVTARRCFGGRYLMRRRISIQLRTARTRVLGPSTLSA